MPPPCHRPPTPSSATRPSRATAARFAPVRSAKPADTAGFADRSRGHQAGVGASLDDGRTLVRISEEGWCNGDVAQAASYGNCHGWTQMLCALKAWLEHGINLRADFYV